MGIPAAKNENLKAIVVKVFACIDVVVVVSNVQNVYRKNNIIIVKLANYDIKAKIIENKRKKRILLSNVYPSVSNEVQIFVNNHTTPYFARILQFGRNAVRDKEIVLASKGCLMKFTSGGDEFLVKSVSHFIEIMDLHSNVASDTRLRMIVLKLYQWKMLPLPNRVLLSTAAINLLATTKTKTASTASRSIPSFERTTTINSTARLTTTNGAIVHLTKDRALKRIIQSPKLQTKDIAWIGRGSDGSIIIRSNLKKKSIFLLHFLLFLFWI